MSAQPLTFHLDLAHLVPSILAGGLQVGLAFSVSHLQICRSSLDSAILMPDSALLVSPFLIACEKHL